MQNTLPQSLAKRIEQEAEAYALKNKIETPGYYDTEQDICKAYTAAATAILQNPGDWDLAGSWVPITIETLPQDDSNEDYPKKYIVRAKGDDPRSGWVYIDYISTDEMRMAIAGFDYLEYLNESTTPSSRVAQLEQALREIRELPIPMRDSCDWYHAVIKIATNALKTI